MVQLCKYFEISFDFVLCYSQVLKLLRTPEEFNLNKIIENKSKSD